LSVIFCEGKTESCKSDRLRNKKHYPFEKQIYKWRTDSNTVELPDARLKTLTLQGICNQRICHFGKWAPTTLKVGQSQVIVVLHSIIKSPMTYFFYTFQA